MVKNRYKKDVHYIKRLALRTEVSDLDCQETVENPDRVEDQGIDPRTKKRRLRFFKKINNRTLKVVVEKLKKHDILLITAYYID